MKIIAVAFGLLVALVLTIVSLMGHFERSESRFDTYEQLAQSDLIAKGWVPPLLPLSAYEIAERHRVDAPHVDVKFRFRPGDRLPLSNNCSRVPSMPAGVESYRCKHATDYVIVQYRADGTGDIRSE